MHTSAHLTPPKWPEANHNCTEATRRGPCPCLHDFCAEDFPPPPSIRTASSADSPCLRSRPCTRGSRNWKHAPCQRERSSKSGTGSNRVIECSTGINDTIRNPSVLCSESDRPRVQDTDLQQCCSLVICSNESCDPREYLCLPFNVKPKLTRSTVPFTKAWSIKHVVLDGIND